MISYKTTAPPFETNRVSVRINKITGPPVSISFSTRIYFAMVMGQRLKTKQGIFTMADYERDCAKFTYHKFCTRLAVRNICSYIADRNSPDC